MHDDRTARPALPSTPPPPSRRVRGLGFVDVLCLELEPCQLPWLRAELELAAGATAEAYEARLLQMIRAQLPESDDPVEVCGPGPLLAPLVAAAAAGAASALSRLLRELRPGDARASTELVDIARAARSWAEVYADCQAIEWYSFDPDADPVIA